MAYSRGANNVKNFVIKEAVKGAVVAIIDLQNHEQMVYSQLNKHIAKRWVSFDVTSLYTKMQHSLGLKLMN